MSSLNYIEAPWVGYSEEDYYSDRYDDEDDDIDEDAIYDRWKDDQLED